MACFGIVFVDVDAFKFKRLTVDKQADIGLAVDRFLFGWFDFNTAETDIEGDDFHKLVTIFDIHQQLVEVRAFGTPCLYAGYIDRHFLETRNRLVGI